MANPIALLEKAWMEMTGPGVLRWGDLFPGNYFFRTDPIPKMLTYLL